jgi:ribulose 1,5-bisphosphate synthetase/thiazole synthase
MLTDPTQGDTNVKHRTTAPAIEVPVLIVGGGPVGMLCAIMLAKRGLSCLVQHLQYSLQACLQQSAATASLTT